jgi:tetratricopeptide (TPR) repeat protein
MLYEALVKEAPALDGFQALLDIYRRQGPVEKLLDALGAAVLKTATLEPLGDTTKQVSENTELMNKLFAAARSRQQAGAKSLGEGVPLALGMLAVAAKRYDEADEFYTLAAEAEAPPKAQVLLTWGLDMLMAEQYDRAARVFQRGIDEKVVGENNADFHFYLSGALGAGGKIDEAIAAAQQAAQIDPKSPRVLARVPWILYQAKRHAEAEKSYVELLARLDDDHSSSNVRATVREMRFILSNLCVLQERMPDAEEWLEQVLDEFPEDVGALNDLGYLWADQGEHLQRALAMIRRAVAAEPDNAAYRDSLGWVYYRLGRYDEAIKELEEAAKGDDPDGVILDHLGDAHLKAEHRDQAIATWQRAVTAFQKNDDAKSLEKTTAKIKQHSGE